ncbi:uncharacterized protein LOC111399150 [Olea europaea var. sylvestris]|uniref:uncharacterized protein LOC111399150 n=1 Tax=Olea europaea var. sylvestris TaxID=158386 RepID=UPI000C1D7500|nr:uncharacterized protein LOC111399150 [Olea europaea var. sylvestris]
MEDAKAATMAQQQQFLLLQQLQRQKQQQDAISRFPSNIDAHLRPPQHHLLHHRPPTSHQPQHQHSPSQIPNSNSIPNPPHPQNPNSSTPTNSSAQTPQQQQHKASLQLAYHDAWRVCHPDFKSPFSSLEDACERLLPYHVVADYEAEEDDKILDSDTTGQILSRSQQWDHNIAAKVAEFTATFEKQVLAFNIISRKRGLGEFRTEEKLMMEQLLLQEQKQALLELRAEMGSRQKATQETHEANMRMAAHAEMMARVPPIRANALGSQGINISVGHEMGEQDHNANHDGMMNGWSNNAHKDDKEPSDDFLNDEETENGDTAMHTAWHGTGDLDLNAR